jgi:signal peptidase I
MVPEEPLEPEPRRSNIVMDILKFTIVAFMVVTPFRLYVAQPFIVSGASMEPTFEQNEYLVVDQISYRFEEPERGDVIIFRYPLDPSSFFIKRIVGLPGEMVEIKNGEVFVYPLDDSGVHEPLTEPYIGAEDIQRDSVIQLEDDEYFVLGDNRVASSDSRVWGPLHERYIVGRALARLLPLQNMELLPGSYEFTGQ